MKERNKVKRSFFERLIYFFPLQLLFVHLKKNHQLLLFWLLFFLMIYQQIGNKYGVPYLFLGPEYLGKLSFSSYFILGFAFGGFVMSFNISSYIMNGFRFPFLATLSKPFFKYCINNSLLPLLFIILYSIETFRFLRLYEGFSTEESILRLSGFLGGYFIFILISLAYFMATNKDFEKLFGKEIAKVVGSDTKKGEPAKQLLTKTEKDWYKLHEADSKSWRVDSYLGLFLRLKQTRAYKHYNQNMLSQVFRQNHINASVFELVVILSIIVLGLFRENEVFIIPAAATLTLLFTMLLMVTSALRSWLRGWTWVVILGLLLGLNELSKYDTFYYESRAPGLSYEAKPNYLTRSVANDTLFQQDIKLHEERLQRWKLKNTEHPVKKPKAIFISASGGGSRAMLWSFLALQHLDSLTNGQLFKHSVLMNGSSGGMIGSAYFRELRWQQAKGTNNVYAEKYRLDLAQDLLNPVFFTLAVNDMLIRTQRFEYEGQKYWKDRGYIFEKTLNENSRFQLDKPLGAYREAETKAAIPLMVFTPSIVNDSRRLLISNLPMSFMSSIEKQEAALQENIEFLRLFSENDPLKVRFLSVLRMNASFPYIMPTINLPSNPTIEVFDSGLRDNFGIKSTLKYIFHLRKWLEQNTSGIVLLQIRDDLKSNRSQLNAKGKRSISDQLLSPFGSLYGNWFQVQDFNNDELIEYASQWFSGSFEVIPYQLKRDQEQSISLSWHLTSKEKEQILSSLNHTENQAAAKRLQTLLTDDQ